MIPTLEWTDEGVRFLDQTKLPLEEVYVNTTSYGEVATVIRDMIVRGAPAIGVSAGMGMALGIDRSAETTVAALTEEVDVMADVLARTRPTAVNLFWGIERIRSLYRKLVAEQPPAEAMRSSCKRSKLLSLRRRKRCTTKTSPHARPWASLARTCCRKRARC